MKELADILVAFDALCAEGKPAALATVIAVEGSAYRRPGARMLVAEDGRTWGGVSGGCLEQDVARRARGVIDTGKAVRFRYDETGDIAHKDKSFADKIMFWKPGEPRSIGAMSTGDNTPAPVDAAAEDAKIKALIGDKPVVIAREKKTRLKLPGL